MKINFSCERCGHTFEVDESLIGKHGHCKGCGHEMIVPSSGFRLAPLPEAADKGHNTAPQAATKQPSAPRKRREENVGLAPVEKVEKAADRRRDSDEDEVDDGKPYDLDSDYEPPPSAVPSSSVPVLMEARAGWRHTVRVLQGKLAVFEDAIYLVLMVFWVIGAGAFLFELKPLAWSMLGALVLCSILLLFLGGIEVFVKPFQESLRHGLAFVLLPPYAIYYVATRWKEMKRPFRKAVGAFVPLIVLLVLAFLGRPIRDWYLHPPPKKDENQAVSVSSSELPGIGGATGRGVGGGSAQARARG